MNTEVAKLEGDLVKQLAERPPVDDDFVYHTTTDAVLYNIDGTNGGSYHTPSK